ncbi:hypothetical protein DL766_007978 [Monosporascus sp. MC13-8B]|nr:hypothetical protein DL763_006867 [Monosporascus cannonballus]RYP21293.1 hypothetical protein DL766_007978 [Monosporascus sp. MC13-8B]
MSPASSQLHDSFSQIKTWNQVSLKPVWRCIHDLVTEQATNNPDGLAIDAWDGQLTYHELEELSGLLASNLRQRGVRKEIKVPICFEKSKWAVVSILAILKAGGAFVPLDPAYPVDRLQGIVAATGAPILLASRDNIRLLAQGAADVVEVSGQTSEEWVKCTAGGVTVGEEVEPSNAAYVLYTSGSTGTPKGCVVEHSGFCSSARAHSRAMNITADRRVFQFASYAFDASMCEILTALTVGACICIPSEDERLNDLGGAIRRYEADWMFLTPTTLKLLDPDDVPCLRTLVVGGEASPQHLIDLWCSSSTLGRGIGTKCWVVDFEGKRHCRIDEFGELLIESPAMARGYLDDAEKTRKSFIDPPEWLRFMGVESKLYRTGDLVAYAQDGTLVYAGRVDHQVKVRGQRMELGEVEHAISMIGTVDSVIVMLFNRTLLAVVSFRDQAEKQDGVLRLQMDSSTEWRERIREVQLELSLKLPQYMIPTTWLVSKLPTSLLSGKLDRKRVADWVSSLTPDDIRRGQLQNDVDDEESGVTKTEKEMILQQCCGDTLNLHSGEIGLNRSFLELGGDSITAMQLVAKCRSRGIGVTVKDILRSKSLRQLARNANTQPNSTSAHLDDEDESEYYQPFDLSPIQRFFFEKSPDGEDHFNQSFLLELKVGATVDALRNAIEAVMERHVMLRARFRRNAAGEWLQLVCPPHEPSSYMLDHAEGLPEDKLLSTIAGFQARLDLRRGPLVAFGLWVLDSGTRVLFASCHHAVIDLVSWRVILQELEEHLQHGRISSPKTISFPRWLSLQREYFKKFDSAKALPHDIGEPQLEFWGVSRLQNKVEDVVTSNFVLDAEATTALLSAGGRSRLKAEPVDLLVGCLIFSFHNVFSERQTPVVFNEGHGREPWSPSIDVSRTVGWFTTMLPVQSQCESLIDTIIDVKDARRIAPLNGLAYFSSRYLNPKGVERYGSHQESEIIFNYEGIFQQFERSGGLFRQSPLSNPHQLSDNGSRSNRITLFEWTATVKRGRLHITVDFHRHMEHQDRILRWAEEYNALLRRLPEELMRQRPIVTRSDTLLQLPKADWIKLRRLLGPAAAESLEDLYDCTPMQEGMLISQSRDAQLYMVDITATIKPLPGVGGVDLQRLHKAWETVEVRHSALRTYFAAGLPGCGAFSQVVLRERVSKVLGEESSPCRFVVREQGDGIILMHLRISHVAADADSLGLILRDISLAYDGRLPGEDAPRYSQYIAWCEDQDDDGAREYWAKYTQGLVPCRVPATESTPEPPTYSRCNVEVPDISGIQHFCTAQNVTISHIIHAAWALVLRAYLAQDEVCFGYFASDRDMGQHGANDSVGVFVNALVCRVRLHENMTVEELVKTMREDCIDGLTNQRGCSLAKIQHDLGGQQLFNTGVSVQRAWVGIWESELCSASNVNWEETNDFGLAINVIEGDAGLEISLGYAKGTIAETQVQSIASAFGQVIRDITLGNVARKIPEVLLISKGDRSKIGSWNGPRLPAINECIHHLFKAQVKKDPNAIAIDSWDGMMTYAELDKASDVLAHDLISRLGLQVGERVPFCFEKSRWVLVSILGILKAGAAFVPLEQSHPADRLQWMATAVKARVAIVSPQYRQKLESVQNVLPLDQANFDKLNQDIDMAGFPAVTPDDIAAILFTSGSSGKPKGCVWQHRAWCSSATRQADGLYMRDSKRMLQFASYSFGASLIEMLTPLQLGATICIISDYDKMNNVEKAIAATGADAAVLPPSLLRSLNSLGSIKTLICGGESLDSLSIDRFSERIHLVAGYGSTEGAVVTCSKLMSKGLSAKCIGRPFNGSCWIVSPSNYHQLLPIGAVGELLIEGPHLAQGYLDQPEKTADGFIDDATWMPSVKYYRTGDLARFDPDTGDIYYAGRKDNMVKINGMRVELGEVEAHLKIYLPDFQAVAAELVEAESLPAMLMGFIAMGDGFDGEDPGFAETDQLQPVTAVTFDRLASRIEGLDEKLAEKLPRHMIPATYFPMRDLPLTASRKIDRVKLKSLGRRLRAAKMRLPTARRNRSHKGTLSTEMERHLKALWDNLLPGHSIGPDDNFFSLGGDSLLAMRLVKKTSSSGSLTVADVFKYPTLSAMAAAITKRSASIHGHAVEIAPFSLLGEDDKTADAMRNVAAQCGVDVTAIQDLYPCTSLQMGMLALSAKHLGSHVAHLVIDVPNCFDEARFRTAARLLVQQNPILRTRFVNGRQVLQAVVDEEPIFENVENVTEYLKEAKNRTVEFGQPLSCFVFSNDGGKATRVLVWSIHHALYDGWSIPLMMRDLGTFYDGKTDVPPPRAPFNTFVAHLESCDTNASRSFWRDYIKDTDYSIFPPLPHRGFQPAPSGYIQRRVNIGLNAVQGVTLPTVIRAAWGLTSCAYASAGDVVFGTTLTGRDTACAQIDNIVGPTIVSVPIRFKRPSSGNVKSLLQRLQSEATAMIPHQHYGLQSISKLNEVTKHACEFTSFLVVHPAEEEANDSCFRLRKDVTTDLAVFTTYAFILQCTLVPGGFIHKCNYDPRILSPEMAERVVAHFEYMIRILTQSSDREVSSIPTISPVDEQLIRQWQGPKIEGTSSCIHQLISEKVGQQPENLAVDSWDGSLTYWQLWEVSSKLAHQLIRLGVVPESRVLVCVDKSKWQIVAVLAILLAGGAFVPIDPSHPRENIQRIIDSAEADVAVIMASHNDLFPTIRNVIEIPFSLAESEDSIRVQSSVLPHNSAYVLYTSGSTGTPKGCVVEHAAFCHSALLQLHGVGLDRSSRVLNFASLSFDAAMGEILTTLILGKTICVLSEYERLNDLIAATTRLRADWAFFTPSLLSSIQPEDVRTLRVVCCGGEAMDEKLVDTWRSRVTFINGYGPTECSVFCCSNLDPTVQSPKNIGRCFSGRAWVTRADDTNALVPVGAVGELIIESPAMARGYLNDEARTAEAFVSSPKWSFMDKADVPRRVYRTGDLVFQEVDGSLVYVRRLDSQVKLRGQRFETVEIERQISRIQDVAQVAVMLYSSGAHAKLVAVISLTPLPDYAGSEIQLLDGQRVPKATEIAEKARSHLGQRLPAFMVPTCVLAVNRIPLTVGGKLDRGKINEWVRALSLHELRSYSSLRHDQTHRKPANALEISIRDIWSSVLNVQEDTISTAASFMHLGGDSISAMQVMARFRSAGIGSATVQEILQANSISELASAIQGRGNHKSTDANEDERLNSLFDLSPVQQWFFSKSPAGTSHFNQSTVLRINRPVLAGDMASAVAAVVKRHSMLRARFEQDESGNWKQKIVSVEQAGKPFAAYHLQDVKELVSIVSAAETALDISKGPVFAVRLFDMEQQQYLFVTAHHLVVDLVSWRIILRDLEDHLDRGKLSEVSPSSFRTWLEGRKGLLGGIQAPESIESNPSLDYDAFWGIEENENVFSNCQTGQFQLSEEMTAILLKSSDNPYRAEPQELMMTAIVHSFRQVFEERSLPQLHTESHGRRSQAGRADSFETVGWFTSLHPVIPHEEPADVWEALRLVKDEHRLNAARETDYLHDTFSAKEGLVTGRQIKDLEVIFNYMGRFQQMEGNSLFTNVSTSDPNLARELETKARSINPGMRRFALFDISALVDNQRLSLTFVFPRHALHQDRILAWIQSCQTTLSDILLALPYQTPTLTLSDLPLLGVDNEQLKRILSKKLPRAGVTDIRVIEDAYPCSPLQKGMLIAQLKDPRSYLVNLSFEITSSSDGKSIDLGRLSSAWRQVVNRHSIFRTLIIDDMLRDGEPCQVVLRAADADVQVVECDIEETIYENLRNVDLMLQDSRVSLPHRLVLYKGPNSRIFFKLEISHVLFDAFSVPIILREINLAYENRLPGVQGPQYSDFISHIQSQETSNALAFWKHHLEGVVPCHIPHDDSKGGTLVSGAKALEIKKIDITGILAYCQKERVTLANVLQTAWALVLRAYTKQDDVCFSYMCSGRDVPVNGVEAAIGPFISLLVCRLKLEAARRVAETATKIQDDYLASLPYQHAVSLAEIQQILGLRGRPLFNTGLSFARLPDGNHETSGLIFREVASRQSTDYDIAVNANVSGSDLRVRFTYNPIHISERQTGEVAECLVKILDGIAASGDNSSVGDVLATVPNPTTQSALLSTTSQRNDDTVSIPRKGSRPSSSPQPRTTTEAKLQKLWAEAFHLNQEEIGMDDHFHQIGGDSLMAMRICSAAREADMPMSVADIFKNPVLIDLASCVDSKRLRTETDRKVAAEDAIGITLTAIGNPSLFEHAAFQAGVSVADIEAIVEATDTQASMVAAGMKQPRTQIAYFTFDFTAEVDSHRLRAACEKLVQHHSILRTAFFGWRRRVYHVILKEIPQLDWTSHGGCDDLDKTSDAWIQASQSRNVEAGQQLTRFCFLQHNSGRSRLLLELSHAQYDGISFPLLLDGLQKHQGSVRHWRNLLRGSSVTEVASWANRRKPQPLTRTVTRTITSRSSEFACALKAAWAGVLARMNGTSDVVFGQLVSGRNLSFPGAEQVLGACVQTVPVRANIADRMTWGDLMRQLRQQQIDSIPHETLGMSRIINDCTDWSSRTRLSTVVNHLNVGELQQMDCSFGGTRCRVSCTAPPDDSADLGIASIVRGDHVDVSLAFADNVIPASYAQGLADMLCSNIQSCLNCPDASVMPTGDSVNEDPPLLNVHPIVRRAWDAVLGGGQEFGVRDGNRPYWDFWDNDFAAAQLATHFKSSGMDLQTDDVVEMPTMALQSELVVERLGHN